ncbi:MAG TPA: Bax inhibitor-1/YccA family protein [Terracidiphilus sp.]|nr:Bax inhibitor-1/YccA family protein [Terracidiphilus sp.]
MPLIKTSNPALGQNTFSNLQYGGTIDAAARMTLNGTIHKTGILLLCALATAAWTWSSFLQTRNPADIAGRLMIGAFGGLIFAFVTAFKKEWAPVTAPIYAALEGLVLGGLSAMVDLRYPGIAIQAVGLTFGTLFVMLFLYRTGIIKVTRNFMIGVVAATGGIMLFYVAEMLLGFFGIHFISMNNGSPLSILFSLFVVGIAALNLVLDFNFVEQGVTYGVPKYMEWYAAFGIMVTLVWLYIEILNLLSKMNSRR